MTISITTHWLAKLLRFKPVSLTVVNGEIALLTQEGNSSINLAKLDGLPFITEGLLFSSLHIGETTINGLPKNKADYFLADCHKVWYLSRSVQVQQFRQKASRYLTSCYVRSSKFMKLQQFATKIKSSYRTPPRPNLLPPNIEKAYNLVDQIIAEDNRLLKRSRAAFMAKETGRYKTLFDTVESNELTQKQREACVIDDDNNLVLAGAGTGKTSMIVGKAGYLVESGKAKPEEILLLAFGNEAAKELQERIDEKLKNPAIKASTFHKIGKKIIARVKNKSPSVSDLATDDKKRDKYVDNLLNELLKEPSYAQKAVRYFEEYLYPDANPFDFKTKGEYFQYLEENEIRSLKGDLVRSHGELLIANYLFGHGIEYKYEAPYKISTLTADFQQYKPDFYLVEHDIYLEHYGIDRNNNAPFTDSKKYNDGIEWKRKTHKENGTICLKTFHYEKQEGILLDSLTSQLKSHDIPIEPIPDESILETLKEFGKISILSKLLSSLLCNVKNSCQTIEEAIEIAQNANNSPQSMAVLGLLLPILEKYGNTLKVNGEIDFNDMIHHATRYVNEGKFTPKWKYILIDEFQDIASSRANLVKALRDAAEDCILFCVGDDWQSIYRFAGSDLNYTTEFGAQFGNSSLVKLDKTYRFNNSICDIATKFITQNPIQERKHLITNDHVDSPAVSVMRVEGSCNIVHVRKALDRISALADKPSKVYVISRYNFLVDTGELKALSRSYPNLTISQISMHGSKGKEADYVIIVGLENGESGFPSEKTTHPLLELYLPPEEPFPNAEERRLFYVAITRAKKRVYLIADMAKASSFMTEMLKKDQYELCLDEFDTPIEQIKYEAISCPSCSTGTLSLRVKSEAKQKLVGCSNSNRCSHTESCCPKCDSIMSREGRFRTCIRCGWKIPMCMKCNGEMKKRPSTGHWGCSNYRGKENIPTCTFQEKSIAF